MFKKEIDVNATWDEEARVWVAVSEDVPGLVTEADTMEQLVEKLKVLIPELFEANGQFPRGESFDIPMHVISKREELIKRRM